MRLTSWMCNSWPRARLSCSHSSLQPLKLRSMKKILLATLSWPRRSRVASMKRSRPSRTSTMIRLKKNTRRLRTMKSRLRTKKSRSRTRMGRSSTRKGRSRTNTKRSRTRSRKTMGNSNRRNPRLSITRLITRSRLPSLASTHSSVLVRICKARVRLETAALEVRSLVEVFRLSAKA